MLVPGWQSGWMGRSRDDIEIGHLRVQTLLSIANCALVLVLSGAGLYFTFLYNQNSEKNRVAEELRAAQNACVDMSTKIIMAADTNTPPKKQLQIVALADDITAQCGKISRASSTLVQSVLEAMTRSNDIVVANEASDTLRDLKAMRQGEDRPRRARIDSTPTSATPNLTKPELPGRLPTAVEAALGVRGALYDTDIEVVLRYGGNQRQREYVDTLAKNLQGMTLSSARVTRVRVEGVSPGPSENTLTCLPATDCALSKQIGAYMFRSSPQPFRVVPDSAGNRVIIVSLRADEGLVTSTGKPLFY